MNNSDAFNYLRFYILPNVFPNLIKDKESETIIDGSKERIRKELDKYIDKSVKKNLKG